jgi:epoxyqueuosine reductase QueG
LEQRFHGTMLWMERDPQRRADPTKVLPGCQSMIVVGMNYYTDHVPDETQQAGRIARAADNLGYAKVELSETIAEGHAGCRVVVYLKRTADSGAASGREYVKAQ